MDIYLISHTSIDIEPGICYGHSDIDVADSFANDAEEVRQKLSGIDKKNTVVYSSPLKRCRKLASVLTGHTVHTDSRLQELNFGDWELKRWSEIPERLLKKWSKDIRVPCPGGESYLELNSRVVDWWRELMKTGHESVLVITHAGVIQSVVSHVLGIPLVKSSLLVIDWGHLSAISTNSNNYVVKFINR